MFFHFVKKGDTLEIISKSYNISEQNLIDDNSLLDPNHLVVNQCLLINNRDTYYQIKPGDNLTQIAKKYHTTSEDIIKLNPKINATSLKIGENILIKNVPQSQPEKIFNGYCYESSNRKNVEQALKSLTFLSIFSYGVKSDGSLNKINDDDLIALALSHKVKPIMVITNSQPKGGFSPDLAHDIIANNDNITRLINNVLSTIKSKGYYGLNIDFEYVNQGDKSLYIDFIKKVSEALHNNNLYFSISLAPKYSDNQKGLLYEAHDYNALGQYVDNVILMTYEWGYTYGPAMAIAPYNEMKKVIEYGISRIDSKKILMGIPNYGYDFLVPFKQGQKAKSITNPQAIPLAYNNHAQINHSPTSKTPYFKYKKDQQMHEVHFDDPYSIQEKLSLIDDYHLGGGSIWTISTPVNYYYLLINHYFEIDDYNI